MGGQGDLVGDAAAEFLRVQPAGGDLGELRFDLGAAERDHRGVLGRRHCRAGPFQDRDPVHTGGAIVTRSRVGREFGEFAEAGEQRGQLLADRVHRLVRTHVRKLAATPDSHGHPSAATSENAANLASSDSNDAFLPPRSRCLSKSGRQARRQDDLPSRIGRNSRGSGFADPDGNTWAVQELRVRGERPLILVEARGRFGATD
ncbi:hypothetical protein Acsp07_33130 [Actinomycetospora sp. NBRC 106378]|nr:hypothetical protein Acsp07_33130 [Actinomycetospora sp. NBRC 106378]